MGIDDFLIQLVKYWIMTICDFCGKMKGTGGYCYYCKGFTSDRETPPVINSSSGYTGAGSGGSDARMKAKPTYQAENEPVVKGEIKIRQSKKDFKHTANNYTGKKLTKEENLAERKRLKALRGQRKRKIVIKQQKAAAKAAKEAKTKENLTDFN